MNNKYPLRFWFFKGRDYLSNSVTPSALESKSPTVCGPTEIGTVLTQSTNSPDKPKDSWQGQAGHCKKPARQHQQQPVATAYWILSSARPERGQVLRKNLNKALPPKNHHLSEYLREQKRSVLVADCSTQTSLHQAKDDKGVESLQAICISIWCCRESRMIKKK